MVARLQFFGAVGWMLWRAFSL